jgi:pyruvate kinase
MAVATSLTSARVGIGDSIIDSSIWVATITGFAAAREIAETTDVKAICCFSESGTTAALVARERPRVPIIALTNMEVTARRLCLTWGTKSVITASVDRFKLAVLAAIRAALAEGVVTKEDKVIVTAGVPFNVPGSTNILRVAPCEERLIFSGEPE